MNVKPPHSNAYPASCLRLKLKHPVCRPKGLKHFIIIKKIEFIKPGALSAASAGMLIGWGVWYQFLLIFFEMFSNNPERV
jgi:hypothetical protein